jgi:hypothetical protein
MPEADATFRGQLVIMIHENKEQTNNFGYMPNMVNAVLGIYSTRCQLMIRAWRYREG